MTNKSKLKKSPPSSARGGLRRTSWQEKLAVLLVIAIVSGVIIPSTAFAQLADSPWPTFHRNSQRTGLSPYDTSQVNGTIKWSYETGGGIESSPSIRPDGTIYVGSHDGYLYAVNPDGTLKWKIKIGTPLKKEYIEPSGIVTYTSILSAPSISKDGTIYIASRDQYLFAISSEGKEKWRFPIGVSYDSWVSPVIGSDGTIYMISSPKGGVYAINPDGTEKWHYNKMWGGPNSLTIDKDGTIYGGFPTGYKTNALIALNPNGSEKWRAPTELFLESSPSIGPDGTIYIGSFSQTEKIAGLYAISHEGKIKWHLTLPTREVMSTPAIGKDGTIYFGDDTEGIFYAVNPDGTLKWSFATGKAIDSSPAIGREGTIYFGSSNGKFYALNPDGTEKWHYDTKSSISSSPAIGSDGTVYIGSWNKKVYAFGSSSVKKDITALAASPILYFFWASGCPHCEKEKVFLNELGNKYPQLTVKDYEITSNRKNLELLQKVGIELQADISGVPFTVIGKEYFAGYLSDETTGKEIETAVGCAVENGCEDLVSGLSPEETIQQPKEQVKGIPKTLKVPIFGELQVKTLSLPLLTFVIALLDGFNPCAMWTLLFLISLLLGMKGRRRMWALGIAFITSSAFVYFLFLSAWLNLFLVLGFVVWIRILIGFIALAAGGYYLRDYLINKEISCKISGDKKQQKIFEKIRGITQKRQFLLALGGIILLAVAVNMIELVCSAGLPAIYTKILSLSNLPAWQYYLYLLFYILIFMLDDLFVFFVAMLTLQVTGIHGKYSRYSRLIGGVVMFIVGLLLLLKPEWLMFG